MFETIEARVRAEGLTLFGGFHARAADDLPQGTRTVLLLGPAEPEFWGIFTTATEYCDGVPDPLDRWSKRVVGSIAAEMSAEALFPFQGPPWHPFLSWAVRSGCAWTSPVGLLVHDQAGLMLSYRGALALRAEIVLPPPAAKPCEECVDQPCRTACPAGALSPAGYDVPTCKSFLETAVGQDCMTRGCALRRACPVSRSFRRLEVQSAFHMQAFHPADSQREPRSKILG